MEGYGSSVVVCLRTIALSVLLLLSFLFVLLLELFNFLLQNALKSFIASSK